MCGTSPFVSYVNLCILSNKIQLVRPFWAVSVTHFLCCDCSEDRVALTTVRSPNKVNPKNLSALFFLENTLFLFPLLQTSGSRASGLLTTSAFPYSTRRLRVTLQWRTGAQARQKLQGPEQAGSAAAEPRSVLRGLPGALCQRLYV